MVFMGIDGGEKEAEKLMGRSQPLHNFTMPCLKWGNQRLLRCMKVDSNGEVVAVDRKSPDFAAERSGGAGSFGRRRESEFESRRGGGFRDRRRDSFKVWPSPTTDFVAGDGEIEATREKLMLDFQTEVGKIKDAILREGLEEEVPETAMPPSPAETVSAKPWNLRTRRAACKEPPDGDNGKILNVEASKPNFSPLRNGGLLAAGAGTATPCGEKREREKFSVALSRSEIDEDFTAMTGRRLPRKPKKRPKIVQRQLDTLFPGLWLTEVNADDYKVPDAPESKKR